MKKMLVGLFILIFSFSNIYAGDSQERLNQSLKRALTKNDLNKAKSLIKDGASIKKLIKTEKIRSYKTMMFVLENGGMYGSSCDIFLNIAKRRKFDKKYTFKILDKIIKSGGNVNCKKRGTELIWYLSHKSKRVDNRLYEYFLKKWSQETIHYI